MLLLTAHLLSLCTLLAPINSCTRNHAEGLSPTEHIYSTSLSDRDTANRNINTSRHNAITEAVAKASPAVVGINVTAVVEQRFDPFGDDQLMERFFGRDLHQFSQKYQVKELGSGFLISKDGYILTNDHVAGNATKIIVTTTDGAEYDAKLIGTDHIADIALLKIDGKNLPFLKLGNSSDLSVGEWAIAMGNPFGLFDINDKPTVTVGVISNTDVNLGIEDGRNYRGMVQTDAAISSGNSGGPLLNANGDVVGMNAVIRSTAQSYEGSGSIGLGFAIPINKVKIVVDQLRNGKKVNHNFADPGFRVSELTDDVKSYFKITGTAGVVVTDLRHNSPAAQGELEVGDLIVAIDGERVRRTQEVESILADHKVGDTLKLTVMREGKRVNLKIPLNGV